MQHQTQERYYKVCLIMCMSGNARQRNKHVELENETSKLWYMEMVISKLVLSDECDMYTNC